MAQPASNGGYSGGTSDVKYGSGLTGESDATVEVTPWRSSSVLATTEEEVIDEATQLLDMNASFEDLAFDKNLLRGIYEMGFVKPSKIQAAALPLIGGGPRGGNNMIGQAQNGSGKT